MTRWETLPGSPSIYWTARSMPKP